VGAWGGWVWAWVGGGGGFFFFYNPGFLPPPPASGWFFFFFNHLDASSPSYELCVGESARARERHYEQERKGERESLRTIAVGHLVVHVCLVTLVRSVWERKRERETESRRESEREREREKESAHNIRWLFGGACVPRHPRTYCVCVAASVAMCVCACTCACVVYVCCSMCECACVCVCERERVCAQLPLASWQCMRASSSLYVLRVCCSTRCSVTCSHV